MPEPTNLQVHSDLDGDQILDTARVHGIKNDYVLSIDLSTRQSRPQLPDYHTTELVIGIEARDVDGDHNPDIVLLGLNPLHPSGLWLNEGSRGFRAVLPWIASTFHKESGGSLMWLASETTDTDPGNVDEPAPDAVVSHYLLPSIVSGEVRVVRESRQVHFGDWSSNVPLRGPPLPL